MGLKERRTSRAAARLRLARPLVVNGLRLCWAVVVVWGELGVYFWAVSSCRWPDAQLVRTGRTKAQSMLIVKQLATGSPPTHVMLLSDPQVKPPNAMPDDTWGGYVAELVFDVSMKKSWRVARTLKPDVVIFLGDMLSGGKYVRSEKECVAKVFRSSTKSQLAKI